MGCDTFIKRLNSTWWLCRGGGEWRKKKSCRGETVSEQSATLPLKLLKPHKAKRQKPETHPGPESVDEAEREAALTECDFGQKKRGE